MGASLCWWLWGVTPSRPCLWRAVEVPGPLSSLGAGPSPLRLLFSLRPVALRVWLWQQVCAALLSRCGHLSGVPGSGGKGSSPCRDNCGRRPLPLTAFSVWESLAAPRTAAHSGRGPSSPGRAPWQPSCPVPSAGPFRDVSVPQTTRPVHRGNITPLSSLGDSSVHLGGRRRTEIRDCSILGGNKVPSETLRKLPGKYQLGEETGAGQPPLQGAGGLLGEGEGKGPASPRQEGSGRYLSLTGRQHGSPPCP